MKKFMTKLFAGCLAGLLLTSSVFAYVIPDYSVSLEANETRIYVGDDVEISFNIDTEEFLMTDMSIGYEKDKLTSSDDAASTGIVEFFNPEIKGSGTVNSDGSYTLDTKYTFTACDVDDTVEVEFTIENADIVHSYESAKADENTKVTNTTPVKVIIVKQYDVDFVDEDGATPLCSTQTIDKGLGDTEDDTALIVPSVSYDNYVKAGLVADYYEHVWTYDAKEYTDSEVAEFGKVGGENEIKEDTTFVLDVREQTFSVNVPAGVFDTSETPDEATYGTDYTGKINPYDDKYDYTVKYDIGGVVNEVECNGDSFEIPGENITGDMTLSIEKELNIAIKAYAEYVTGYFLITVDGDAVGYTFDGNDMYESKNHESLRAWLYESDGIMTEEDAEAAVEALIFTTTTSSPKADATYNINGSGEVDLSDAALVHGAYLGKYDLTPDWVKIYLISDLVQNEGESYTVDTDDFDEVVNEYKGRNN